MFNKTIIVLCGVAALGSVFSGPALAHRLEQHRHAARPGATSRAIAGNPAWRDAEGYASARDCAARLPPQPGDAAIMIQDRFYRESVGDPFWAGECR